MMKKIGKYEIIGEIGKGAMGVVYKAHDSLIGRDVAIKMISESILDVPEIKERFYREARSVGKLSHENICVIYDVGEDNGRPYIVMEYLPGDDLRSILNRKTPLPLTQKLDYLKQVCRGLHYAHTKNIIHRDIKPENIKILEDGKVKIMDFGIAKPLSSELTHTGTQIGTPWYMSPEQIRGTQLDQRADIFSFGVVFYELLAYRRPFDGEAATVMYKILQEPPARLNLEESQGANELEAVVMKCLEKEVEKRHPDFISILKILDQLGRQVEHQESVQVLIGEGRALMQRQLFREAIAKFDDALRVNPSHTEARALRERAAEQEKYFQTLKIMMGEMQGETISHYRISERIGAGGMGIVYKAEDSKLRRPVALKFLPPELTQDEPAKKRFVREAQAASALDHPNIYTIYEIDETPAGQLFICMAYYDGLTLKKTITDCELRTADCVNIAIQIAQGLVVAHAHGIIHRDIKPANVIITKEGVAKIVDFGLAKLAGGTRITKTGVSMGTLAYMSPEQIRNTDIDHRTDIWALGVILYEMLSTRLPFQGDYDLAQLYAIPHQPHIPIAQFNSGLSRELEAIIDQALQKQAADRYASMQEMLKALKQVQRQLGGSSSGVRFAAKVEKVKPPEPRAVVGPDAEADSEIVSLLAKGKYYLEQKKYAEAISRFRAVLEVDPNAQQARELIAECERLQKEQQQIAALLSSGKTYFAKENFKEARQAYAEVLALSPDNPEALDAVKKIEAVLAQSELVEKLLSDAEFYLKKEKFEPAGENFKQALALDPENKRAGRGLQRVEKGRENLRRKTDRPKITAPLVEQKPGTASVWKRLVAVIVLGIIGATSWYLLTNSNSRPGTASKPPAREKTVDPAAAAAKQALAPLKTEAEKVSAETWAAATYENALQSEQRGDRELKAGNLAAAMMAYVTAAESLNVAITAAQRAKNAAMNDLNQLKEGVANVKRDVQKVKAAAERAGARTGAADLFARAEKMEQEGERNMSAGSDEGLVESLAAAQQAYTGARNLYAQAKAQMDMVAQARVEAESARLDMDAAKKKLPEPREAWPANTNYANAEKAAAAGNRQYQEANYGGARDAFQQAKSFYHEAVRELKMQALQSQAGAVQASMLEARDKVDKTSLTEAKYREAEQNRAEGDKAFEAENFAEAAERYAAAKNLYVAVANEAREKQARKAEQEANAQREIRALINRFKTSLEQRDLQGVRAVYGKTFMKEDEKAWTTFFKKAREIKPKIEATIEFLGNDAKVGLTGYLDFFNTTTNEDNQQPFTESWLLERNNGSWMVAQRKPQ